MAELLRMPEVAANTTTATLAGWLVEENRPYDSDAPLATIETDKAVVDLNADGAGVVLRYLTVPGTEVRVGDPIAVIGQPGEPAADVDAVVASLAAVAGPEEAADAGTPDAPSTPAGTPDVPGRIFASPLARRLAKEAGLSTGAISPSGPNGRIVRRDVEAAIAARSAPVAQTGDPGTPPAPVTPSPATVTPPVGAPAAAVAAGAYRDEPHTRMRRAIAAHLTRSKQEVPHFYLRATARVDALVDLRARVNEVAAVKVSLNDFVVKAVGHAHRAVPAVNAIWTADAIRSFRTVDVAIAVATETGLVTPVLRDVERLSITAVAAATRDFAERARAGALHQHELEGGSSTVTNLGMYGTEEFAAIINPPQSSILAVGAAHRQPVVVEDGTVAARSVLDVTLSVDHRVIDGALAAAWMRVLVDTLQAPLGILL